MQLIRPLLLVSLLLAAQAGWAGTFSQIGSSRWVTATKIYDGDTFRTDAGEKVRLLGINTPETAHNDNPGQPLARKAREELKNLIQGEVVRLEFDRDQHDVYGRLLTHVYLRDGTWVNARMIEKGMAHCYTFAPNFRHAAELLIKERQARDKRRGIWKTSRFGMLKSAHVDKSHVGQFRVISGKVGIIDKKGWSFRLGNLSVSIPESYRQWFRAPPVLKSGDFVAAHGKIRISNRGRLYLALHSPYDLEIMER
ncbi:MAG: thermonuclease family protein [Mariprofundaceae bacterium]|nr:thermonuclease family protein [Mariprofundaceae bacterium]